MKTTITVIEPDFYNDFHCTAGDCRNNCCVHPWTVSMDKKNYKLMRSLKEPRWLSENFGSYIRRNSNIDSKVDYATIQYNEGGCVFQDEQGLCKIQRDIGSEYLCTTCRVYPRAKAITFDKVTQQAVLESGLHTSCEEVTRMLLHRQETIKFVRCTKEAPNELGNAYYKDVMSIVPIDGRRPILHHYHSIRDAGIGILQDRCYSFEHRLILLCILLDKLEKAENDNRATQVPQILESFAAAVKSKLYDPVLANKTDADMAKVFANYGSMYNFHFKQGSDIAEACDEGIKTTSLADMKKLFDSYMADKEYFLEHIFVSEFFLKCLPFYKDTSIWESVEYMVALYAVMRFVLSAYLAGKGKITETEFIDFVAYLGKTVMHSDSSFAVNTSLLKINNMESLAHMVMLING